MRLCVVILIAFSTVLLSQEADSVSTGFLASRLVENVMVADKDKVVTVGYQRPVVRSLDDIMLSKWSLAVSLPIWAYTTYYLGKNWQDMEGNPDEPWTDHHIHSGMLLHAVGVYLKNYQSEFYKKNLGVRAFFSLSPIILLDDAYQHLYLQPNDGYYAGKRFGPIANSPIGGYYHWALRPERSQEYLQLTFFHIPVTTRLDFSIGHWQGIFVAANYRIIESRAYSSTAYGTMEIVVKAVFGFNQQTRVAPRQFVMGPTFKLIFPDAIELEFGVGAVLYRDKSMEDPRYNSSIFKFWTGIGLPFNR